MPFFAAGSFLTRPDYPEKVKRTPEGAGVRFSKGIFMKKIFKKE
ncbi:MAG: hypothetical protein U0L99_06600 [Ruminococcus sp.]|nr:hypothetical protein [Ruminococcus sp.]